MFPVLHAKLTFSLKQNKTDQRENYGNRKEFTKLAYGGKTTGPENFAQKTMRRSLSLSFKKYQAATQEDLMFMYILKYHKNIFL